MCKYCSSTPEKLRGKEIYKDESFTVFVWEGKKLMVDTEIDDMFAEIKIKYCPMCGRDLK